MDLKIGDLVAFKKYDDMDDEAKMSIRKECFPDFGKVSEVYDAINCFKIEEEESYTFSQESIDYIIAKGVTNEHFILQEDHYEMYVTDSRSLSLEKSKAKVYKSRGEASEEAADMHLNAWDVIPYDD